MIAGFLNHQQYVREDTSACISNILAKCRFRWVNSWKYPESHLGPMVPGIGNHQLPRLEFQAITKKQKNIYIYMYNLINNWYPSTSICREAHNNYQPPTFHDQHWWDHPPSPTFIPPLLNHQFWNRWLFASGCDWEVWSSWCENQSHWSQIDVFVAGADLLDAVGRCMLYIPITTLIKQVM